MNSAELVMDLYHKYGAAEFAMGDVLSLYPDTPEAKKAVNSCISNAIRCKLIAYVDKSQKFLYTYRICDFRIPENIQKLSHTKFCGETVTQVATRIGVPKKLIQPVARYMISKGMLCKLPHAYKALYYNTKFYTPEEAEAYRNKNKPQYRATNQYSKIDRSIVPLPCPICSPDAYAKHGRKIPFIRLDKGDR